MRENCHTALSRVTLVVVGGLLVLGCVVLFFFDPRQYHFYPTCLFHQMTGLLCPGCGSLRALHQLLHGHLVSAFRFNPLLVVAMAVLTGLGLIHKLSERSHEPGKLLFWPHWLWALGVLFLAVSIWRNLPGAPPFIVPPGN